MTETLSSSSSQVFIRLATLDDLTEIADGALLAFVDDPVMNFFGNVSKTPLDLSEDARACKVVRDLYYFLTKSCILLGGRITLVIDRSHDRRERIVAVAAWYPPCKRVAAWMVPTLLKCGFLSVIWGWGLEGFKRVNSFHDTCEKAYREFYTSNNWAESPDDSWYLQYTYTIPEHQGKGELDFHFSKRGHLSRLMREAFAHSPNSTFMLEATTPKSRDRYDHLGFNHSTPIRIGQGKSSSLGVKASGKEATGFDIWAMAKRLSA